MVDPVSIGLILSLILHVFQFKKHGDLEAKQKRMSKRNSKSCHRR